MPHTRHSGQGSEATATRNPEKVDTLSAGSTEDTGK